MDTESLRPEPCDVNTALEILREPSVLKHLKVYPEGLHDNTETYLLGGRCLFVLMPGEDDAEVHIACPYRARAGLKTYLRNAIEYTRERGFREIWTTAPEDREGLQNMLKSLGFTPSGEVWRLSWA